MTFFSFSLPAFVISPNPANMSQHTKNSTQITVRPGTAPSTRFPLRARFHATSMTASQRPYEPVTDSSTQIGYAKRETPGKGEGVFATKHFQQGETVMVGFIITEVSENHSHATQVAKHRWVQHGGLNSLVNHSCDPNCGVRLNENGAYDFVARKDIPEGTELTFDYAMRNYVIEHFPGDCRCGAPDCRRSITGYKDLPANFKTRYKGFIAPYLLEMDTNC